MDKDNEENVAKYPLQSRSSRKFNLQNKLYEIINYFLVNNLKKGERKF